MIRPEPLKGMRDWYPDRMRVRRHVEARWREVAERFGFEEVDGPALETLELYTRKSGDEIAGQLYAFADKGDRQVALRPEMTPTLARMVAARGPSLPRPIKWYSIPRLWRYERPQRGRLREFWQLNLDIFGVAGVEADAEIIAAGVETLRACGLGDDDVVVRYSDRRLLDAVLAAYQIGPGVRPAVYAALDKLVKAGPEAVVEALGKAGVPHLTAEALTAAIARRDLAGLQDALAPTGVTIAPEAAPLVRLAELLDAYGVGAACAFDAAVVRGLAYYTGIVFEMYDRKGELRAICGGGRYDGLIEAAGGEPMPAVGFGLGEAVLTELLEERGLLPADAAARDAFVLPVTAADRPAAVAAATRLRAAGLAVELALEDRAMGKSLKRAAQAGARVAVVIGEAERAAGEWTVKDLATGAEERLAPDALVARLAGAGPA